MAENKMQVTTFQDGDDYVVVFHNCKPDMKKILLSLLSPMMFEEAAESLAKPEKTAEKEMPVDREKEMQMAMEDQMADDYIQCEDNIGMEPLPEDLMDAPAVKTLGDEFGAYAECPATVEDIANLLNTNGVNAYKELMRVRRTCLDREVSAMVGKAVVSYLKDMFSKFEVAKLKDEDVVKCLKCFGNAIPARLLKEYGISEPLDEALGEEPVEKLRELLKAASVLFTGQKPA